MSLQNDIPQPDNCQFNISVGKNKCHPIATGANRGHSDSTKHLVQCGRATVVKLKNHICTSFNFTLTLLHTLAQAIKPFTERGKKKTQIVKISIALFMSIGLTDLTNLDESINKRGGNRLPARHTGNILVTGFIFPQTGIKAMIIIPVVRVIKRNPMGAEIIIHIYMNLFVSSTCHWCLKLQYVTLLATRGRRFQQ